MAGEERKDELILNAAINIFAESGYEKATIGDIARKANIPEPTIYRICGPKEAILLLIYERFWTKFSDDIRGIAESRWGEDAIEKLKNTLIVVQKIITQDFNIVKIIATTYLIPPEKIKEADNELRERRFRIRRRNREVLKYIDEIILKGQENKQITSELKPQVIRQILIGAFQTLSYGLFVQFSRSEDVGYTITEATKGINYLFQKFLLDQEKTDSEKICR